MPSMGYGGGWSTAPRYVPQYASASHSQGKVIIFSCFVGSNDSVYSILLFQ
jgi:hypothetical protein